MAENVTIARPYADAAFSLAQAANALGGWSQALDRMAAVAADPQMQECIGNPGVTPGELKSIVIEVVGGNLSIDQENFVQVLAENERLAVLPEIRDLFVQLKNGAEGTKAAIIQSAFALDGAALTQLVVDLEQRFGCKIQATVSIEPDLIGGVRIAVGDQVIDASVRGKLASMATALKN
ncbi:MAG: F0F1 ATP synthase subunit delta [Rhodocyclaceae bacterium]|nr:F0F1 ATP synthase subunit delta [Rhodocyclaceae bacterium]